MGTETDGSIVCPSSINGLVGIKPTVGLVSRSGIIPISRQPGHGRSDGAHGGRRGGAARRAGRSGSARMRATTVKPRPAAIDYSQFLKADGLRGARIGVARNLAGFDDRVDKLFEQAIEAMRAQGAVIVDKVEIKGGKKLDDAELTVLHYEFKDGLNAYLATRTGAPRTLEELIAFNEKESARELQYFGQEIFTTSQAKGPLTDREYRSAATAGEATGRPRGHRCRAEGSTGSTR